MGFKKSTRGSFFTFWANLLIFQFRILQQGSEIQFAIKYLFCMGRHTLSQRGNWFSALYHEMYGGKTWYYAEYYIYLVVIQYVFLYISCYIAEIWITLQCTVSNKIGFSRYNMKCSGENVTTTRNISYTVVSCFHYISCYIAEILITFRTVYIQYYFNL